ncbi:response regulator [Pseudovibrio sp. POLY-S9]|uniref:response regulator n=1 Tax=Pseudovibrio sp. POLY-S9 TaxID=1576596 RepID=UPI000709D9BC|nr:response regulator [Pseudovibrio sp. POLY-S9]
MSVKVLIVEDDAFKAESIRLIVEHDLAPVFLVEATSVHSAINAIHEGEFDLILLDMSLPSHEAAPGVGTAASMPSGGMSVLMELDYLGRTDPIVILTQYREIEIDSELVQLSRSADQIKSSYGVSLKGVVLYKHGDRLWKNKLREYLRDVK